MPRDSYRQRIATVRAGGAASGTGPETPGERHIRAVWAADPPAVEVMKGLQKAFIPYPRDSARRCLRLADFEVCPLAGEASVTAYRREALGALEADDFVLIYSIGLNASGEALASFVAGLTPRLLAQDDAPVLWLGAAQHVDLNMWEVGDTRMGDLPWQPLHPTPPGRFRRENPIDLDDDLSAAAIQVLRHARGARQAAPGGGGEAPAGLLRRVLDFLHLGRGSSDA